MGFKDLNDTDLFEAVHSELQLLLSSVNYREEQCFLGNEKQIKFLRSCLKDRRFLLEEPSRDFTYFFYDIVSTQSILGKLVEEVFRRCRLNVNPE